MLTAEISPPRRLRQLRAQFLANLPTQLDWVDRATGGQPTLYLGQTIADPNGLLLTEFWNRSIKHV